LPGTAGATFSFTTGDVSLYITKRGEEGYRSVRSRENRISL